MVLRHSSVFNAALQSSNAAATLTLRGKPVVVRLQGYACCVVLCVMECKGHQQLLCAMQISMIDGQMFDTLEALARGIRGNQDPFGGIQLILSGLPL